MTREKTMNIRTALVFGLEVQKLFPQIADEYTDKTLKQLAQKYKIAKRFKIKFKTAISVIQKAICGYDGKLKNIHDVPAYSGLITNKKVHAKIVEKHQTAGRSTNGKNQVKKYRGIHAQTISERIDRIYSALRARGIENPPEIIPFSKDEKKRIRELYDIPEFKKGKYIWTQKIANAINAEFHGKKLAKKEPARSYKSVSELIRRMHKTGEWDRILTDY